LEGAEVVSTHLLRVLIIRAIEVISRASIYIGGEIRGFF